MGDFWLGFLVCYIIAGTIFFLMGLTIKVPNHSQSTIFIMSCFYFVIWPITGLMTIGAMLAHGEKITNNTTENERGDDNNANN